MPTDNFTPLYDYEIGESLSTMANIELMGLDPPFQDSYRPHGVEIAAADGLAYGHGWPVTAWRWGYISQDNRDILRDYCSGKSSIVYIRILGHDNTWEYCKAVMIWPERETPAVVGNVIDFSISFRILENYGASIP